MRKVLLCLIGLSLLASAVLAETPPPSSPDLSAVCVGTADADVAAIFAQPGDLPDVGVPSPSPRACEHNFCTLSRDLCAQQCAPCSFDFRCRNVTCEYTCTCTC
ncbi:MAG TPA: hypothetical protein VGG03_22250 [Thermoanaerobaculia bacterium]|jgi:hypothetical protein